jgi:hypothetical protein
MPIDTKQVPNRRKLTFTSLSDLLADAERMAACHAQPIGNWSAGQIFEHLARAMNNSIDGTDVILPWYFRPIVRLLNKPLKKRFLGGPLSPGFQLPASAARKLVPGPTSTDEGLAALRAAIARLERETKRAPNPVLGFLTVEEWNQFHLNHAGLHMSYLVPQN